MTQSEASLPNNHVVAVISSDTALEEAVKALEREGMHSIHLFRGEEAAETFDAKAEKSNPLAKVVKAVQDHLSEEPNFLAQYEEEARNGNAVLAVHVDDGQEQAMAVKGVLERYGAHNIRYFGRLAVADLTPETNPSSRSEESPESGNWSKE